MNVKDLDRGFVVAFTLFNAALLAVLILAIPGKQLIIGLNGVFLGVVLAFVYSYRRLLGEAIFGTRDGYHGRVRVMSLAIFGIMAAYILSAAGSVYLRATGLPAPDPNSFTIVSRYLAIVSTCGFIVSPDLGHGVFYGRDRKTLWSAATIGLSSAMVMIYAQIEQVLSF